MGLDYMGFPSRIAVMATLDPLTEGHVIGLLRGVVDPELGSEIV